MGSVAETGTLADTIADTKALKAMGVAAIDFDFEGREAEKSMAAMRAAIAEERFDAFASEFRARHKEKS